MQAILTTDKGSSPRMRGTPSHHAGLGHGGGIIPAYAGNTPPCSHSHTVTRDHPRVCGEHPFPEYSGLYSTGSSPRMRGTRISAVSAGLKTGIIPAYAGNTAYWAIQMPQFRDHPRVCGEHVHGRCHAVEDQGSSPRMRGTRTGVLGLASRTGIIPAYAGNTLKNLKPRRERRDHPRVCGEHPRAPITKFHDAGSSPRMRGTPSCMVCWLLRFGIIPAYAGNTTLLVCPCADGGDHPRVCGEHLPS